MLRPGLALGALLLAASLGQALPIGGLSAPPRVWELELSPGEAAGIASNLLGSTYVAGTVGGQMLVWKLDPVGARDWDARPARGIATSVAALPSGGAVVAGYAWGADTDVVVAAVDDSGELLWTRTWGTPGPDAAYAVAAGPRTIHVAGTERGDAFLAALALDGTLLWTRALGASGEAHAESVALFPDESALLAGWTYDGVRNAVLLAKYDSRGALLWERVLPSSDPRVSLRAYGVGASPAGSLVVGGVRAAPGVHQPMALGFDPLGELGWLRLLDGAAGGQWLAAASDPAGGGLFAGSVPGRHGEGDWLVARYGPDGTLVWTDRVDGGGDDAATGIAWSPASSVTVSGTGAGTLQALRYLDSPIRLV